jgi:hypothetical protein
VSYVFIQVNEDISHFNYTEWWHGTAVSDAIKMAFLSGFFINRDTRKATKAAGIWNKDPA